MILNALYDYYTRKVESNDPSMPSIGMENKELKFLIEIDSEGNFLSLYDLREGKKGRMYLVPKSIGRSGSNSWQTANLLWDHVGYVLGYPKLSKEKDADKRVQEEEKNRRMASKQHEAFKKKLMALPEEVREDEEIAAVIRFYEKGEIEKVFSSQYWEECAKINGCNVSFQVAGSKRIVPETNAVKNFVTQTETRQNELSESGDEDENKAGRCLVTGSFATIARLHKPTPVSGNSPGGGQLVAFQRNSGYDSYGKSQGENAPVSTTVEFGYTAALNHLLGSSENRIRLGSFTCVFWAERPGSFQSAFASMFSDAPKDDPDSGIIKIRTLLKAFNRGEMRHELDSKFFVLGIEPNAARLMIRIWEQGTQRYFAERINQHFKDFALIHGPQDPDYLTLPQILRATALDYKMDKVAPSLCTTVFQSILTGTPYPEMLFQQALIRIRATREPNYRRTAILKAYINRAARAGHTGMKEVSELLDKENINPGYRLGRLFAVLERIQETASPKLNATIRDRYYGAASTAPITVFPRLLNLKNHHLAKIENRGFVINREKDIGEVLESVSEIPANLSLPEQAYFALGYYHQRQDYFTKKPESSVEVLTEEKGE